MTYKSHKCVCTSCGRMYSISTKGDHELKEKPCPDCGGKGLKKVDSGFAEFLLALKSGLGG